MSDAVDTLKDAVFGGICLGHQAVCVKLLGLASLVWLWKIHLMDFTDNADLLQEMANTYLSVWRAPPQVEDGEQISTAAGSTSMKMLVISYKQTTQAKRDVIKKEESVQTTAAIFVSLHDHVRGRPVSPFVVVMNICLPFAKYTFATLGNPLLRGKVQPWLKQQFQLAVADSEAMKAGLFAKLLNDDGAFTATLKELREKAHVSAALLKDVGTSASDLREAGFSASDLKGAGFSALDLKGAGFSVKDLKDAGFSAKDLMDAGFSAKDLEDAGFSAKDLKLAGFSA